MRKKIIAGVLALTLVMGSVALPSGVFENVAEKTSITASAYEEDDEITSGDYKYGILDDGTVEIAEYLGSATTLTIPSTLDGKKVTSIGYNSFAGKYNEETDKYESSLVSITIPNSVTSIGGYAFACCTSLASITIPNGVTSIQRGLFYFCRSLTNIILSSSITSIGTDSFLGCASLVGITIPKGVKSIYGYSFAGCKSLKSITIPDSVTSIGESAFNGCTSLKSVIIPSSVISIEWGAFSCCTSLKNVTIPKNVTSVGNESFGYYYNEKNQKNVKISGFTITCYFDSAAGVYARNNKIACKYINYIGNSKVKLSKTSYSYSGKANKPAVTIMYGKTKLKSGKDYTYTYKNNKAIGTASVVIKGKGKYNGTKAVTFKINPKKQTVKLASYNNAFKATWKKDSQATGYQVMYAKAKSFKDSKTYTVSKKTLSKKIKGKNKTTYYVKVRTYKTVSGNTYCGAWSTAKAVKTK